MKITKEECMGLRFEIDSISEGNSRMLRVIEDFLKEMHRCHKARTYSQGHLQRPEREAARRRINSPFQKSTLQGNELKKKKERLQHATFSACYLK